MNQDDIFKLLLIILLLTNERDNVGNNNCSISPFSNLNEIIIIVLLLNTCNGSNFNNTARDIDDIFVPPNTTF